MKLTGRGLVLGAVPGLVLALVGEQVRAVETGVYQAPDLGQFLLIGEEDGDGDGDGVNETRILRYRNLAGDSAFSMTTKDRVWAWSLESHGPGEADPERNYVIRDSDCDGRFDERYGLDEQFHVPDCLK
jgi:hypothetical protein